MWVLKHVWVLLFTMNCECFVNLVQDQGFTAKATMSKSPWNIGLGASNAIDGDTGAKKPCTAMNVSGGYESVWWKVWLQRTFNVAELKIYFRPATIYRSTGFSIYVYDDESYNPPSNVSGSLVYQHDPSNGCPSNITTITVNRTTQGIAFYNTRQRALTSACIDKSPDRKVVEICEVDVLGCDATRYSQGCSHECDRRCLNQHCDAYNGKCIYGCSEPHRSGPYCADCKDGYYGVNCTQECGHCTDIHDCDTTTGVCLKRCLPHWNGSTCDVCAGGYYGENCSLHCGHCEDNKPCDQHGHCPVKCTTAGHWMYPKCQECDIGFYGENCTQKCGHCVDKSDCNKASGVCRDGCQWHWNGSRCDVCADGYYGDSCSLRCGRCKDNKPCDQTGHCPVNCTNVGHWQYPKCQDCVDGFYGSECNKTCGHCMDNTQCNKTTGHCVSGCRGNWMEPKCQGCVDYFYDEVCSSKCGSCANNASCNKMNGICDDGCSGNFQLPLCHKCVGNFYGPHCNLTCGHCKGNGTCDKGTGKCTRGCQSSYSGDLCQSFPVEHNSDIGVVAGGIASGLLFLAVGVAILMITRRRRLGQKAMESRNSTTEGFWKTKNKAKGNKYMEETPGTGSLEEQELTMSNSSDGGYYNIASVNSCIRVDDLQRIIAEKNRKENNIFAEEYKRLPTKNTEICGTAQRPENVLKNRFKTIFPYEHSRVVLEEKWNPSDNDYINASYIKDNDGNARFIAAQGPKKTTIKDFWRMMWQGNIKTVVMLTNIVENGKNKCSRYWPDKDQPLCIGPCTVTLSEEVVYSFYVVRRLCVQNKEALRKRTITQYHYTAWPDHGTPEEISLIQFHRAVLKTHQRRSPLLVHCSAGVGRTGTFIALDTLLEEGRKSGEVNVLEFVKSMREDRMTMVQTVEQYVFLHKALLDGLQGSCTAISESDFQIKVKNMLEETSALNQRQLYCEFKKLLTLKPAYDDEEKEDSKTPENLKKNVSIDILPVSKHRPYLATYVKGRNDYINAVIVPSFTNPIGFIITQKPLVDTEVDLWRMCMDHETDGIVVLNNKDEEKTWIPYRGSSRTVPPFNITAKDIGSTMNGMIQGVLGVSDQDRHRSIDTFQLPANDDKSILKGIELLLDKTKSSTYRTIVMSTDGAGEAGIFCAVHNAVQELRWDGEIDLFTIVRQIHVRKPEVIVKLDEYRRCYGLLMTLLEAQGIYANL